MREVKEDILLSAIQDFKAAWEVDPILTVYVNGAREVFCTIFNFKDILKNIFPKDAELFEKLLDTRSENEFLKILKNSGYTSGYISIQNLVKDGTEDYCFV